MTPLRRHRCSPGWCLVEAALGGPTLRLEGILEKRDSRLWKITPVDRRVWPSTGWGEIATRDDRRPTPETSSLNLRVDLDPTMRTAMGGTDEPAR